jgi:hypothetical protein
MTEEKREIFNRKLIDVFIFFSSDYNFVDFWYIAKKFIFNVKVERNR